MTPRLVSPEFQKYCDERFKALDSNGDGSLDKEELEPVITDMIGGTVGVPFCGGSKLTAQVGISVSNIIIVRV